MVGMNGDSSSLMGFLITYLYGFLFILFPMIVTIILSNKLIASHTDKGSMAYLLSSPNSRTKIVFTQMKVLGTFITCLLIYITFLSIAVSHFMFPGELVINKFLLLNLGLLILHFCISGICFLASILSNETKTSLIFGAGIPVVFFLIQMLSNMGGKLEVLKYFSIFTLFDPNGLINGTTNSYIMIQLLLFIGIILFSFSVYIFKKRDLSV
jgi:ABC-2 type transport system permease protein